MFSSVKGGAAKPQDKCVVCKRNIGRVLANGKLYCYNHTPARQRVEKSIWYLNQEYVYAYTTPQRNYTPLTHWYISATNEYLGVESKFDPFVGTVGS